MDAVETTVVSTAFLDRRQAREPSSRRPLEGPVYFRSNGGERPLSDIVADLNGQLHVTAVGFVKSVKAWGPAVRRGSSRA